TPINKLDSAVSPDGNDCRADILRDDITTVLSDEIIGAYATNGKWIRGYGTRFSWKSVNLVLREQSCPKEAIVEDIT
ncbi:6438_t:CDS:2, partial [Dentiscutata heterogama]